MNRCIKNNKRKIIPIKENGRSLVIRNPEEKEIDIGQIDDCLITDQDIEKCDKFARLPKKIYLVELKGKDIPKAVSQIVSTTSHLTKDIGNREIIPVIIATKCPAVPLIPRELKKLKDIKGNFKGTLILKSRKAEIIV